MDIRRTVRALERKLFTGTHYGSRTMETYVSADCLS